MKTQLVLINRPTSRPWNQAVGMEGQPLSWQTCIRQVLVSRPEHLKLVETVSEDQIFNNQQAYQFLLEVICGLHSPIVGETEVFGQFKSFFEGAWNTSSDNLMKSFLYELNRDAKEVRRTYLRDLGGTSYGSLVRKHIREHNEVHILGSGHLAKEILPWVIKSNKRVILHSRNVERMNELKTQFPALETVTLKDVSQMAGVLIVAAPVRSHELNSWLNLRRPEAILDLRGESAIDPLEKQDIQGIPVKSLREFFQQMEVNKAKTETVVRDAKQLIQKLSEKFALKHFHQ